MSTIVKGIPASKGVKIARAYKLEELNLEFKPYVVTDVDLEITKLDEAMKTSLEQIEEIQKIAELKLGEEESAVFDAHKLILMDPDLKAQIENSIKTDSKDAASAAKGYTDTMINIFANMDDEYMRGRAVDIKDVSERLLANLLGLKLPSLSTIKEEAIIVAQDLTPSETSQLNKDVTLGFATNIGGRTSHAAIMARSMEIPAIVGTVDILAQVQDGDILILDAISGEITINPTESELEEAQTKIEAYEAEVLLMQEYKNKESISKDGHQVELVANIGTPNDLEGVIANGAEGVGLYRTEFLYMDSTELPSEEVQFEAYKKVLTTMENKPVVVRTLDIGGDKELSYLKFPEEMNPFLGYRAIRLCLDRDDIFRVQLRALLRASAFGNLKIMFPMIATLDEFRDAKAILLEEKENLKNANIEVSDNIEVGIMVEIPSTAMMADTFAKEVDFMSIGTNDLIQYTMACDRMSDKVAYLYQPYNPAILRMIKNVVDAMDSVGKWSGMCGEMASDPVAIVALLGLGLHEFSMSASAILPARMQISNLKKKDIEPHLETILSMGTANDVEQYIRKNFSL